MIGFGIIPKDAIQPNENEDNLNRERESRERKIVFGSFNCCRKFLEEETNKFLRQLKYIKDPSSLVFITSFTKFESNHTPYL